jgi:hypothetical protein
MHTRVPVYVFVCAHTRMCVCGLSLARASVARHAQLRVEGEEAVATLTHALAVAEFVSLYGK